MYTQKYTNTLGIFVCNHRTEQYSKITSTKRNTTTPLIILVPQMLYMTFKEFENCFIISYIRYSSKKNSVLIL